MPLQVVFAAKANQRSQETSLRFHLFRWNLRAIAPGFLLEVDHRFYMPI